MNSKIVITFGAEVELSQPALEFVAEFNGGPLGIQVSETWVAIRQNTGQVTYNAPTTNTVGEKSAIGFVNSFVADYNVSGNFTVSRSTNVVTIEAASENIDFLNFVSPQAGVTAVITNVTASSFQVTDVTFQAGTPVCDNVLVQIQTTTPAVSYSINGDSTPVSTNPFSFSWGRGLNLDVTITDGTDSVIEEIRTPRKILESSIILDINQNPAGAIVTASLLPIVAVDDPGLTVEWSVNGTDYQTSGVFSNLVIGSYTMYCRDEFGCIVTKIFEVTGTTTRTPFLLVPKSNSFRFANRIVFGDCSNYKNDENTLSCEAEVRKPFAEELRFQTCDIITTQFKSNYTENLANIIVDGVSTAIPVVKQTNFLNRRDQRQGLIFSYGDGTNGVYFTTGEIQDPDTNQQIGTYTLNGSLPEWGVVGNYVFIMGDWRRIDDIIFDENKTAYVLIIEQVVTNTSDLLIPMECIYNLQNYDVYEFTIDLDDYQDDLFQIEIINNDSIFESRRHLSEVGSVKVRQENTIEIEYWNETNTDVYYQSGIRHKARVLRELVEGSFEDNPDVYSTDTDTRLLSEEIYEIDSFTFQPVTKQRWRQLVQALSHTDVFIDGVKYVKGEFETDGPLEDTNLYELKATMRKAQNVYNSNTGHLATNDQNQEIPALVDGGSEFIRYQ